MTGPTELDPGDAVGAITAFWGTTRLVVIDVETVTDGNDLRAVAVGVVHCQAGFVNKRRVDLVRPPVPVDADSARIHGLTDDHLANQPEFADVADIITGDLTAFDDEDVVFVAHNAAFDISVLRAEYALLGQDIVELPVLDTTGRLASDVDVHPDGRSLRALCHALGLPHARPHDALDDAFVCAEAAVELLNRAAVRHGGTIGDYLTRISGTLTTHTTPIIDARIFKRRGRGRHLPADHIDGHSTILSRKAGKVMLADWTEQVDDCARLRCRHLDDRVANAEPSAARLISHLETVLKRYCADGDSAGAATVLAPLLLLLEHLPPNRGRLGFRNAQLHWAKTWRPRLAPLGRCSSKDRCPQCRSSAPCPLDTWPATIAANALGDPVRYADGFFETTGKESGTGAWTSWITRGHRDIADEAIVICHRHWMTAGYPDKAGQLAQQAWAAGCQHPAIIDRSVGQVAAAGGITDLRTALATTRWALRRQDGSTHESWIRLQARAHQLDGELRRLRGIDTGLRNVNGDPVYKPRHHPTNPHRTRPQRFRRTDSAAASKT